MNPGIANVRQALCALRKLTAGCVLVWSSIAAQPQNAAQNSGEPHDAADALAAEAIQILHRHCFACHGESEPKNGLRLTSRDGIVAGGHHGPVVVPGRPDESLLVQVLAPGADPHMPPKKQLPDSEVTIIRNWIADELPWNSEALVHLDRPRSVTPDGLPANYRPVFSVALSPDENRLAVGRGDQLLVFDVTEPGARRLAAVRAHSDSVRAVTWSPDGQLIASGSFREVRVWKSDSLALVWSASVDLKGRVDRLRFSPFGGALVAAESLPAEGGWIHVFSSADGDRWRSWLAHDDSVSDVELTPEGGRLVTASADRLVKSWELVSGRELFRMEAHGGAVAGLASNTNATEIATVSADRQLKIWDLETREAIVTLADRKQPLTAVAWSGDGGTLLATSDDGRVFAFTEITRHSGAQRSAGAKERQLARLAEPLHAVATNADASRIYVGSQSGTVYGLDAKGKVVTQLEPSPVEDAQPADLAVVKSASAPSFVRDVLPRLAKAGCSAGACHARPGGQNGFELSVFSYDPKSDYSEIVEDLRGRRVFPAAPDESLLLLKPTMGIAHRGGQRIEPNSETYQTLVRWIRGGMIYRHPDEPQLTGITVSPLERFYKKGERQQLRVEAHYSDGSRREVTHWSEFTAEDSEVADVTESGEVQAGRVNGESTIIARFMGFVAVSRATVPSEHQLSPERFAALPANNFIDELAYAQWQKLGLWPSELCTDAEFLRRASLDAIGVLPRPEHVRAFLADGDPKKREQWIDQLLQDRAYTDFWAMKWADLLRPNPDRVGVKSVLILDQWLRGVFEQNWPYDRFVRAILAAEGNNHRSGPAVVYRDRRTPTELTTMFSQLFLGVRMECAKCHHHPTEKWSQEDFYQFAAFFAPVQRKGAGLSPPISAGSETFYFSGSGSVRHPVTDEVMEPLPPSHEPLPIPSGVDPRHALADWLRTPDNPFFAQAAVNRVWAEFFGRGLVDPVDDFRVSNPATNPQLLEALAEDFVAHNYDLKHLMRTIMSSRLYQLSSSPNASNLADTEYFSRAYRRRLPAEVLQDAVADVTAVPDEFDGCPPGTRAVQTWSYKIGSHFLDAFGRPNSSSDPPCERDVRPSVVQALHLMNAETIQAKLAHPEGRARRLAATDQPPEEIITELYLVAFGRFPEAEELEIALAVYAQPNATRQTATEDILWALLNSAEFVFNH